MKYNDLRKKIISPFFTKQDLRMLGGKVFNYQLSGWQKKGHIIKLKNGLYVLADRINDLLPEEVSGQLYAPSYISLERVLSALGIIPEVVCSITCVTPKATRRFKNKCGDFSYRHIKPSLFFGYRQIKSGNASYLMAEPEKAWLDFIYLNLNKMNTPEALREMRFNHRALAKVVSKEKLRHYLSFYKNHKIREICEKILGAI